MKRCQGHEGELARSSHEHFPCPIHSVHCLPLCAAGHIFHQGQSAADAQGCRQDRQVALYSMAALSTLQPVGPRWDLAAACSIVIGKPGIICTYACPPRATHRHSEHKFVHKPGAEPPPPPPLPPPDPPSTSSSSPEPERPHKPRRPLLDLPIRPRFIKPSGPRVLGFGSAAAKSTATTEAVYAAARASPTANMVGSIKHAWAHITCHICITIAWTASCQNASNYCSM
jgi:hypothetical protein